MEGPRVIGHDDWLVFIMLPDRRVFVRNTELWGEWFTPVGSPRPRREYPAIWARIRSKAQADADFHWSLHPDRVNGEYIGVLPVGAFESPASVNCLVY